eukprot:365024-Chlamydomonas_euryale.AAC.5
MGLPTRRSKPSASPSPPNTTIPAHSSMRAAAPAQCSRVPRPRFQSRRRSPCVHTWCRLHQSAHRTVRQRRRPVAPKGRWQVARRIPCDTVPASAFTAGPVAGRRLVRWAGPRASRRSRARRPPAGNTMRYPATRRSARHPGLGRAGRPVARPTAPRGAHGGGLLRYLERSMTHR